MDVTVVIPAWDSYVPYLATAVQSAEEQVPRPHVLVVDNASTAPLPDLGARVVRAPDRLSVGAARTLGLREATTPWVLMLDADDVLLAGTIERLLREAQADTGAVAVVPRILDSQTRTPHHWPRPWARRLARHRRTFSVANAIWSLYPTIGVLLDRRAALDAGGF